MSLQEINFIDIFIITLMASSAIVGIIRGFVKESMAFVGWGIATFAAVNYGDEVSNYIGQIIIHTKLAYSISYSGVFLVTILIWNMISYIIYQYIRYSSFSLFDRFLGAMFGFLRGVLFIGLLIVIIKSFGLSQYVVIEESNLFEYFYPISSYLASFIPNDLASNALLQISNVTKNIALKDILA